MPKISLLGTLNGHPTKSITADILQPPICAMTDFGQCDQPECINDVKIQIPSWMGGGRFFHSKPQLFTRSCDCNPDAFQRRRGVFRILRTNTDTYSFSNCESNLASGMSLRFMRNTPVQKDDAWNLIGDSASFILNKMRSIDPRPLRLRRDIWLQRYNLKQRKRILDSRFDIGGQDTSEVFVKFELNLKNANEDISILSKKLKPRIIFSKKPKNLFVNGPFCYAVKKKFFDIMNGQNFPLIFASGYNPLMLGRQVQKSLQYDPDEYISVESDLEMCETTMRGNMLRFQDTVMYKLGARRKNIKFLNGAKNSHGHSMKRGHYFDYRMPKVRESGTADTTIGNSIVYGMLLLIVAHYLQIPFDKILFVVGGDDGLLYFHRSISRLVIDRLFLLVRDLGLSPSTVFHDDFYSGKFFSGRFLPVLDENSQPTLCLCPLIGRCFSKAFNVRLDFGFDPNHIFFDMTRARLLEWNHIPILGPFNEKLFQIIPHFTKLKLPKHGLHSYFYSLMESFYAKSRLLKFNDKTWSTLSDIYQLPVHELISLQYRLIDTIDNNYYPGLILDDPILQFVIDHDV